MNVWDLIILQPMINILITLSEYLFSDFGITIIVLTVIIRFCMLPLTLKQLHATKAMSTIQPKLLELQKKYAKDRAKLAQEQMRMYRESGISPMGCMVPMLIQMPIWIALYQSIILTLAITPEGLLNLSRYLYSWPHVYSLLPLGNVFIGILDLSQGNALIAILVGGTMWIQQKMVTLTTADPRAQAQSRMMLWMMPLMFGFLSLSFPAGLSLYWVVSNIITIVIQYYVTGWGGLARLLGKTPALTMNQRYKRRIAMESASREDADTIAEPDTEEVGADVAEPGPAQKEEPGDEGLGDKRQDFGVSYPTRLRQIRHRPRKGKRPS